MRKIQNKRLWTGLLASCFMLHVGVVVEEKRLNFIKGPKRGNPRYFMSVFNLSPPHANLTHHPSRRPASPGLGNSHYLSLYWDKVAHPASSILPQTLNRPLSHARPMRNLSYLLCVLALFRRCSSYLYIDQSPDEGGLRWKDLSVSLPGRRKDNSHDFLVEPSFGFVRNGHLTAIIGPSGAGKKSSSE